MSGWLASLAMLASAPAAAVASPVEAQAAGDDAIVVTAALKRMKLALGRDDRGQIVCRLEGSSGHAAIDDAVCREAARCVPRKPAAQEAMERCLDRRKAALVKRWSNGRGRAL